MHIYSNVESLTVTLGYLMQEGSLGQYTLYNCQQQKVSSGLTAEEDLLGSNVPFLIAVFCVYEHSSVSRQYNTV